MATISPLLQNRLNATGNKTQTPNNRHEKIYQDLQKRAHEAKPNEAKAKLVKEGIFGNPITAAKDTFKDGKNFFKDGAFKAVTVEKAGQKPLNGADYVDAITGGTITSQGVSAMIGNSFAPYETFFKSLTNNQGE